MGSGGRVKGAAKRLLATLASHPWWIILGAGALLLALVFLANPLRWPDGAVHDWLLRTVPVGSDQAHLLAIAESKGWRVYGTWPGHTPHSDWGGIDGATVIWIYLGRYQAVWRTDLDSFWAFDETGALIDVRIRRMADSL